MGGSSHERARRPEVADPARADPPEAGDGDGGMGPRAAGGSGQRRWHGSSADGPSLRGSGIRGPLSRGSDGGVGGCRERIAREDKVAWGATPHAIRRRELGRPALVAGFRKLDFCMWLAGHMKNPIFVDFFVHVVVHVVGMAACKYHF